MKFGGKKTLHLKAEHGVVEVRARPTARQHELIDDGELTDSHEFDVFLGAPLRHHSRLRFDPAPVLFTSACSEMVTNASHNARAKGHRQHYTFAHLRR